MTRSAPAPDSPDRRIDPRVSDEAVRRLADAVVHLANDGEWFVQALTDRLLALRPVSRNTLTEQRRSYLIESGVYTAEELDSAARDVAKGALQLRTAETWLSHLLATMSLDDITVFLGWTEEAVRAAVSNGRLYAVEISGRLRFPDWQFDVSQVGRVLPHLKAVIEVVAPRWDWRSVGGFMASPQSSLVATGRKTPVEWLRDGGDVAKVTSIVESSYWR